MLYEDRLDSNASAFPGHSRFREISGVLCLVHFPNLVKIYEKDSGSWDRDVEFSKISKDMSGNLPQGSGGFLDLCVGILL